MAFQVWEFLLEFWRFLAFDLFSPVSSDTIIKKLVGSASEQDAVRCRPMPSDAVRSICAWVATILGGALAGTAILAYTKPRPSIELRVPAEPVVAVVKVPVKVEITLINRTPNPIPVYGVRNSCGCLHLKGTPTTLPPYHEWPMIGEMTADFPGRFALDVEFYLDSKEFPLLLRRVEFDVREK